jgi:UDP-N-acetylglucosamine 2-epimerase (non-hydrolysing)
MAPVIMALRERGWAAVSVVSTAQHRHMVDPLLRFFGLSTDHDLDVMTPNQTLSALTSRLLLRLSALLVSERPDLVIGQGDTTTVLATAMACFYARVPFAHVEAGLRTGDLNQPFPEEFNRIVASRIAVMNFAPTRSAQDNLLREGVDPGKVAVTGNTVIDALLWTVARSPTLSFPIDPAHRLLLMTLHRRESFGAPLCGVLSAVRTLVQRNPDLEVIYPVHPNPNVSGPAHEYLGGLDRVHLSAPLDYPEIVAAMTRAYLVLTDSGGIQEEAPALGKPVLVARETTERPEAVTEGVAKLVGTDPDIIIEELQRLLDDRGAYQLMARGISPYGDGNAGRRIADLVESRIGRTDWDKPGAGAYRASPSSRILSGMDNSEKGIGTADRAV